MSKPIYLDGQPDNLEAAALDALDWLRYVQQRQDAYEFSADNLRRLVGAIGALERFLPGEEPEFRETQALTGTPFVATAYEYIDGELRKPQQENNAE